VSALPWDAPPVVERHGRFVVVREDLVEGGSKTRFLPGLVRGAGEVVYGGPFCGGAALALSVIGKHLGFRTSLFYARRKVMHRRQLAAQANGARLFLVKFGRLSNVQAKARRYAAEAGARFLPMGFDEPAAEEPFVAFMAGRVRPLVGDPPEVWCATGSGMLARCLARAFPASRVRAVAVGLESRWSKQAMPPNVEVVPAGVPFEEESRAPCPFPCDGNYDRKAWAAAQATAAEGALFWNVVA